MADYASQTFLNQKINLPHTHFKIGVVTALWNSEITSKLKAGALKTLTEAGIPSENIKVWDVPGSYELIYGANKLATDGYDAVICLGVVIQGETRHFDFVCSGATHGLMDVMLKYDKPVGFCLLTDNTEQQSLDRAGGKHGNKGTEAMVAVLQMLQNKLS